MITIVIKNMHYDKPIFPYDVKVDRSSRLGNPYLLSAGLSRQTACTEYETYFRERVIRDTEFKQSVNVLTELYKKHGQLNLFCWCKPKQCHAETIKRYIEEELRNDVQAR